MTVDMNSPLPPSPKRVLSGGFNTILSLKSTICTASDGAESEVESKLSFSKPQRHRLPTLIMYAITVSTAVFVALTNYVIRVLGSHLLRAKLEAMQTVMDAVEGRFSAAALGALALSGFSVLFATCSCLLVIFVAPQCAGSGLPEVKGYLNGNPTPSIFQTRCFPVVVGGIILSTAAGFPVGREGPMVSIGGQIGFRMVRMFGARYTYHRIRIDKDDDRFLASFYDVDRMQHAKRIGSTLGGAAGIAAAFNAPIGGILYMFEEVTATSWSHECTFRAFVCTLSVAGISRGLLNLEGDEAHTLLIYETSKNSVILNPGVDSWTWTDVPFFILMAAAIGLFSALFSRALFFVWVWRNSRKKHPYTLQVKILECMLYAWFCCMVFALLPLFFECVKVPDDADGDGQGDTGNHLNYVKHACEDGHHAEVATLLLNNAEEAVKHLFSREGAHQLRTLPLVVSFLVYSTLAVGMPGIPVPMGMFVPSMLLGALVGRFLCEVLTSFEFTTELSHPGIYALTGSAAMLSGFTHMTIAIVVLLLEAAHDLSLIAPLMLGASVSYLVSHAVNSHGYDEKLILKKGVPYLDASLPKALDKETVTALVLCENIPKAALLPVEASFAQVEAALASNVHLMDFPILDNTGRCIGLTTRKRLEASVAAYPKKDMIKQLPKISKISRVSRAGEVVKALSASIEGSLESMMNGTASDASSGTLRQQPTLWTALPSGCYTISVDRIMDAAPYTILADMPAPRFYPLFIKAGVNVACVTSRNGLFIGILSRANLIKEQAKAHIRMYGSSKSHARADFELASMNTNANTYRKDLDFFSPSELSPRSYLGVTSSWQAPSVGEYCLDRRFDFGSTSRQVSGSSIPEEVDFEVSPEGHVVDLSSPSSPRHSVARTPMRQESGSTLSEGNVVDIPGPSTPRNSTELVFV